MLNEGAAYFVSLARSSARKRVDTTEEIGVEALVVRAAWVGALGQFFRNEEPNLLKFISVTNEVVVFLWAPILVTG